MRVYIAGPMRGIPKRTYMRNFKLGAEWLQHMFKPEKIYNPAIVQEQIEGFADKPMRKIARFDFNELMSCDTIYMLRGWERSIGARAEHAYAVFAEMRILYEG